MHTNVRAADDRSQLLTVHGLADYLNVAPGTVYDWSRRGTGPRRIKVGQALRYRVADVEAWLDQQSR